ncbi:MAG: cobalamin-dependent protein [Deltaproteobacteria bacterium]|nr:cobalamin-dependent protein [Deltaproteobacteria bacterium]
MHQDVPHLLLINPWIDDFAAYDFWARPLGLLSLGAILRKLGYKISFIDCLDRFHPKLNKSSRSGRFGTGHYLKTPIPKPEGLGDVPRRYSRYGLPEALVREALAGCPRPDVVLVTSLMTYWYPGVLATINVVADMLPGVPIVLGGIYAGLCREHAIRHAGVDHVVTGTDDALAVDLIGRLTGFSADAGWNPEDLDTFPYPCFDLQHALPYVPILTSRGCPFRCPYCASGLLFPGWVRRSAEHVVNEIVYWHEAYGVRDVAFYDDALLYDADNHIVPILEGIIRANVRVRFHTPNAVHIRFLTSRVAGLLFLETVRLSPKAGPDLKVGPEEFERAVSILKAAGFSGHSVGAYLLCGLPGQDEKELETSIQVVKAAGVKPVLAQYSPIPGTALWPVAVESSRYDLASDPIFHNNSIFPCRKSPFSWEWISRLKRLAAASPDSGVDSEQSLR